MEFECFVHDDFTDDWKVDIRRKVCYPQLAEHKEKHYCLFHLPTLEKDKDAFNKEFQKRIEEKTYDFRGVYFPIFVDLSNQTFENVVEFRRATFAKYVSFKNSVFENEAIFYSTVFTQVANFNFAVFKHKVRFGWAVFDEKSQISFKATKFYEKTSFYKTIFNGETVFEGGEYEEEIGGNKINKFTTCFESNYSSLRLQDAHIGKDGKVTFHSVRLQPNWFINCDSRKYIFSNCFWQNLEGSPLNVKNELRILKLRKISNSKSLLTIACRQLADNAETNHRFEEASKFRQMAFECERLERKEKISKWWSEPITCSSILGKLKEKAKSFPFDLFHWGYRWSSGYGENRLWAFFVLFLILSTSAVLYTTPLCEFPSGQNEVRSLGFIEAISYSLRVMVLQRPEPFPINDFGKIVLAFETVLAPLQLALLALAIRRKFMR